MRTAKWATSVMVASVVMHCNAALALPLPAETCKSLEDEQARLDRAGARGDIGRGAQWGRSNLAADRLERVKRLIEVDEQLNFRCIGRKPLFALKEDPPEEPQAEDADGKAPVAKKVEPKGAKPAQKPKAAEAKVIEAKPAAGSAASSNASSGKAAASAGKPTEAAVAAPNTASDTGEPAKPRARPRVKDAYSPSSKPAGAATE